MKIRVTLPALWVGLVFLYSAPALTAEVLQEAVAHYEQQAQLLIEAASDPALKAVLTARLVDVSHLDGLDINDPRTPDALRVLARERVLDSAPRELRRTVASEAEENLYSAKIGKLTSEYYIKLLRKQNELLRRKYFQTETAKNSNFLEAYVNGELGLTRTVQGNPADTLNLKNLGVSPWEAIFRFEPTLAMRGGPQAAIMGSAGLSYAYFPDINRVGTDVSFKENFSSKVLKKSGVRVGAGLGRFSDKSRFLVGAGTQVNAVAIWCLYDPKSQVYMLGLGVSDLDKLKKLFGYF